MVTMETYGSVITFCFGNQIVRTGLLHCLDVEEHMGGGLVLIVDVSHAFPVCLEGGQTCCRTTFLLFPGLGISPLG